MNDLTPLCRQIHPTWETDGVFTSQTFKPSTNDKGAISVYHSAVFTAEQSWRYHTEQLGRDSKGVLVVTEQKCQELKLPVNRNDDPFEGHTLIEFTHLSRRARERKADELLQYAMTKGWQFQPAS